MNKIVATIFTILILIIVINYTMNVISSEDSGSFLVQITYDNHSEFHIIGFEQSDTLLLLLDNELDLEYIYFIGIGHFITKINNLEQTDNRYILIYIDGEPSQYGIDQIIIYNGMEIQFILS